MEDSDNFENWEKLIRAAEGQEGGINRNSNPQAITATRGVYDRFLAKFPLLFGYWKKYADLEFSIAGTEAAEMVCFIFLLFFDSTPAIISYESRITGSYCRFMNEVLQALRIP